MHTQLHTASLCRYVKFDTFHPAVEKGLPVTRVISRVVLQQLLAQSAMKMGGRDLIYNGAHVVGYEHKVSVQEAGPVRWPPSCTGLSPPAFSSSRWQCMPCTGACLEEEAAASWQGVLHS